VPKNLVKFSKKLANFAEFTLDKKKHFTMCVVKNKQQKLSPKKQITGTPHPSFNVCFGSVV
jgi:hypothetical protein